MHGVFAPFVVVLVLVRSVLYVRRDSDDLLTRVATRVFKIWLFLD